MPGRSSMRVVTSLRSPYGSRCQRPSGPGLVAQYWTESATDWARAGGAQRGARRRASRSSSCPRLLQRLRQLRGRRVALARIAGQAAHDDALDRPGTSGAKFPSGGGSLVGDAEEQLGDYSRRSRDGDRSAAHGRARHRRRRDRCARRRARHAATRARHTRVCLGACGLPPSAPPRAPIEAMPKSMMRS